MSFRMHDLLIFVPIFMLLVGGGLAGIFGTDSIPGAAEVNACIATLKKEIALLKSVRDPLITLSRCDEFVQAHFDEFLRNIDAMLSQAELTAQEQSWDLALAQTRKASWIIARFHELVASDGLKARVIMKLAVSVACPPEIYSPLEPWQRRNRERLNRLLGR